MKKYRLVEDLFSDYIHLRYRVQAYSRLFGWENITGLIGREAADKILNARTTGVRYKEIE